MHIMEFFNEVLADIMTASTVEGNVDLETEDRDVGTLEIQKSSVFGEAEIGDITDW